MEKCEKMNMIKEFDVTLDVKLGILKHEDLPCGDSTHEEIVV